MTERELTTKEKHVLIGTLSKMRKGKHEIFDFEVEPEDPTQYLEQVSNLKVVEICECGQKSCDTISFIDRDIVGEHMIASSNLGDRLVFIFTENNKLSMMEIIGVY